MARLGEVLASRLRVADTPSSTIQRAETLLAALVAIDEALVVDGWCTSYGNDRRIELARVCNAVARAREVLTTYVMRCPGDAQCNRMIEIVQNLVYKTYRANEEFKGSKGHAREWVKLCCRLDTLESAMRPLTTQLERVLHTKPRAGEEEQHDEHFPFRCIALIRTMWNGMTGVGRECDSAHALLDKMHVFCSSLLEKQQVMMPKVTRKHRVWLVRCMTGSYIPLDADLEEIQISRVQLEQFVASFGPFLRVFHLTDQLFALEGFFSDLQTEDCYRYWNLDEDLNPVHFDIQRARHLLTHANPGTYTIHYDVMEGQLCVCRSDANSIFTCHRIIRGSQHLNVELGFADTDGRPRYQWFPTPGSLLAHHVRSFRKPLRNDVHSYTWWMVVDGGQAKQLIEPCDHGTFLVRSSRSNPGGFAITLKTEHQVQHTIIFQEMTRNDIPLQRYFQEDVGEDPKPRGWFPDLFPVMSGYRATKSCGNVVVRQLVELRGRSDSSPVTNDVVLDDPSTSSFPDTPFRKFYSLWNCSHGVSARKLDLHERARALHLLETDFALVIDDFLRNVQQLTVMRNHPNIATLYGATSGARYLAFESVSLTLAMRMGAKERCLRRAAVPVMRFNEVLRMVRDVLSGLLHLEKQAVNEFVRHPVITPHCIGWKDGVAKLLWIGEDALHGAHLRVFHERLFEQQYIAPELIEGATGSPASRMFSLAVILLEVCSGGRTKSFTLVEPDASGEYEIKRRARQVKQVPLRRWRNLMDPFLFCLRDSPEARPTASKMLESVETLEKDLREARRALIPATKKSAPGSDMGMASRGASPKDRPVASPESGRAADGTVVKLPHEAAVQEEAAGDEGSEHDAHFYDELRSQQRIADSSVMNGQVFPASPVNTANRIIADLLEMLKPVLKFYNPNYVEVHYMMRHLIGEIRGTMNRLFLLRARRLRLALSSPYGDGAVECTHAVFRKWRDILTEHMYQHLTRPHSDHERDKLQEVQLRIANGTSAKFKCADKFTGSSFRRFVSNLFHLFALCMCACPSIEVEPVEESVEFVLTKHQFANRIQREVRNATKVCMVVFPTVMCSNGKVVHKGIVGMASSWQAM